MENKPKPTEGNRLIVEDILKKNECENSAVYLNSKKVEELNLFRGDTILIKGKKRKDTVSIIMTDDSCEDKKIRLNEVIRKNIGVKIGDIITIHAFSDLKFGKRIHVLPFEDTILDLKQNLFEDFLKPYFLDSYRPIKKGDTLKIKNHEHSVEFKIMEIDPVDYCIVGLDTIIYCEGEPLQREKTTLQRKPQRII